MQRFLLSAVAIAALMLTADAAVTAQSAI